MKLPTIRICRRIGATPDGYYCFMYNGLNGRFFVVVDWQLGKSNEAKVVRAKII